MIKGPPPPRPTGDLTQWARKLTDYLLSMRIEQQRPQPVAPQLLYLAEVQESAARDGVMLFDNQNSVPVVSKGQSYLRMAMENDTPQIADAPGSASSPGTPGQIAWDSDYLYICTGENTWKRASISAW